MIRESTIEEYLVARVKLKGGEVRKIRWIGRNGAPDRLIMMKGIHNHSVWVELKAEGLAAMFPHTPHERQQHREHERMRAVGQRVVVIDSFAGVDALLP